MVSREEAAAFGALTGLQLKGQLDTLQRLELAARHDVRTGQSQAFAQLRIVGFMALQELGARLQLQEGEKGCVMACPSVVVSCGGERAHACVCTSVLVVTKVCVWGGGGGGRRSVGWYCRCAALWVCFVAACLRALVWLCGVVRDGVGTGHEGL